MKKADLELEATKVTCDTCGKFEAVGTNDYYDVCNYMRSKGWYARKLSGKWVDFCCDKCLEDYLIEHNEKLDPRYEPTDLGNLKR